MSNFTKLMQEAAAGQAGGAGLNVEDVFSTYLYEGAAIGSGDIQIQNNLDLSGEGGLVWTKGRSLTTNHFFTDTERGGTKSVFSNLTNAEATNANLMSFNSDGFTLGSGAVGWTAIAGNGEDYASWTFRKAPKFFTCLTYTGNGVAGRTVSHDLGSVPACIIVKATSTTGNWTVYHRGADATAPEDKYLRLNLTNAVADQLSYWNDTAPTSTDFTLGGSTVTNGSGVSYVAYLFAHNDGDGEFGPDADQDIIKCGSYTGNGSTDGPDIDLGFEPQWVMLKNATTGNSFTTWNMYDNMRGVVTGGNDARLFADQSQQEYSNLDTLRFNADGFSVEGSTSDQVNKSGDTYIYIAIRRGPMAVPESASEVFDVLTSSSSSALLTSDTVTTDALLHSKRSTSAAFRMHSRLTGQNGLTTYSSAAESDYSTWLQTDEQTGFELTGFWGTNPSVYYSWKRAPSFFDVVAWTAGSSANRRLNHNLGVTPEFAISKSRSNAGTWWVYHKDLGSDKYINLDLTSAASTLSGAWPSPSATEFGVRESHYFASGWTVVTYLFATLAGISKVGSYTGNGTTLNIDCGFSSGARFVLIKRTDSTGSWWVFDTERGLVAGADAAINLNTTSAEFSTVDYIDPYSAGFSLTGIGGDINASGGSYIFYAIA